MKEKWLALSKRLAGNELLLAFLVAAIVIILGVGLGFENNKVIPVNPAASAHYTAAPGNHLDFMVNWDGPTYLALAQHGYTSRSQANFFPLYPIAVRIANTILHSWVYSSLLVSWLCFAGATYFYLKIIKHLFRVRDNLEALRGTLFFVLFPTAVFLIAAYSEGLFAFLALGAIYSALRKQYVPAALFAMFATATHLNGLFVLVLVGLLLLEEKVPIFRVAATVAVGSLGLVAYMIFQAVKFHNPLAFLAAQKNHSWFNFSIGHVLTEFATLNGLFLILLLVAAVYWWPRRKSFSIYTLFYACIVFLGGRDLSGLGRYALMAFPLQFMVYDYFRDRKLGYVAIAVLIGMLWTFFTLRYAAGYTGG